MPKISIIVAVGENGAIGKDGKLPWHLPADMKFFKETTTGHSLIMGRLTYESLPGGALPNRRNIVLTSIPEGDVGKIYEVSSLSEALSLCQKEEKVFIIGGASVYRQALDLPEVTNIYLTRIHEEFAADTFFPEIDEKEWKLIECEEHKADDVNLYDYSFCQYERVGEEKG